jgi:transposase-like protein
MRRHDKKLKAQLLNEWQTSGEHKSDFANRHGIGLSTFYHWTKHLKVSVRQKKVQGFEPIPIGEPETAFEITPTAVIHYLSGTRLELYTPVDVRHLKALIK